MFLFLNLELGPLVRLVFEGDPLPEDERDRLVPVRAEASVDEDLLEDSQSRDRVVPPRPRLSGCDAQYTREERAGELIITFRVTRGPRYLVGNVTLTGNSVLPTQQLLPLIRLKGGRAVRAIDPGAGCRCHREPVSRVRLHARPGQAGRHRASRRKTRPTRTGSST